MMTCWFYHKLATPAWLSTVVRVSLRKSDSGACQYETLDQGKGKGRRELDE